MVPTFKLLLIGDGGVGKTTFVNYLRTGEFRKQYEATIGVNIVHVAFDSKVFEIWDTAGQERLQGLKDGYYINGQCAIIMFDVTSKNTYDNILKWYSELTRVCGENIPIALCGNKVDLNKTVHNNFYKKGNLKYFDISSKINYNIRAPFAWISQKVSSS
jgi:GTP-binding nuclear protein Ran